MTFLILPRRAFVRRATVAATAAVLPSFRRAPRGPTRPHESAHAPTAPVRDPAHVRELAFRAIDAAHSAGAAYADVRLIYSEEQLFHYIGGGSPWVGDLDRYSVGVRVLVDGRWGFAGSQLWTADEAARLAREAVSVARQSAVGSLRHVELGTIPKVEGTWTTPGTDPLSVPIEERIDFINAWRQVVRESTAPAVRLRLGEDWYYQMQFGRETRAMASSEGTYTVQTLYSTGGRFPVLVEPRVETRGGAIQLEARGLHSQRRGWEAWLQADIPAQIPHLAAQGAELLVAGRKPVELGRFDVVFDAPTTASILGHTVGAATQIDRALGYEANASGSSLLGPDPLARLGTALGAPLLTVMATPALPGGLATVQWDDEGVIPEMFPLITDGVLVDYQTTREQAAWLTPWYQRQGRPVRSHGCAWSEHADKIPLQGTPNLALAPAAGAASLDDLVASVGRGVAVFGGDKVRTDSQGTSGHGAGLVRQIVKGKLGAALQHGGFLFDTAELLKKVVALGGARSTEYCGLWCSKGTPNQNLEYTMAAVPMVVKDVAIVDIMRRA